MSNFLAFFLSVEQSLPLECPLLDRLSPVRSVRHRLHLLEPSDSPNDLSLVDSAENGIGCIIHIRSSNTEADDSSVDHALVLELPDVVEVTASLVGVNSEAEDSVSVVESLGLVESYELELGAGGVVSIDANLVLIELSIQLS